MYILFLNFEYYQRGKRLARDAVKIRWTYYDIPAWGTDGNVVTFASGTDPFVLNGEGIFIYPLFYK